MDIDCNGFYRKLVFVLIFLFTPVGQSLAGYSHDPSLNWHTLKSPHFHLHYHDGLEELARETLSLAETIHVKLSKQLNWVPVGPVNMVLTDEYDFSNGMASPLPFNWIMLFVSPPDDLRSLEDHAGWMELLMTHEYTHTLHLDKARSGPNNLRSIFGRNFLLFPNLFQPRWMIEGYATYMETDKARGIGRGQSSLYGAMMRAELMNGLKPIHQVNQPMASWPAGTAAYLYGVYFYQFLADTYGPQRIDDLIENYSGNLLPFFINSNARDIYGKDLSTLWTEFEQYLEQQYRPQIKAIEQSGIVAGQRLTEHGYFTGPLKVLPDGRVFYISYDGHNQTALLRLDHSRRSGSDHAGKTTHLKDVNFGTRLDVHPTAGILLLKPEICRNANIYYDLYRLDLNGENETRLTNCARYRHATWSADGKHILAVQNKAGKSSLHRLNNQGQLTKTLWQGKLWEVLASLDASPDGQELAAMVWREEKGWNIERFNLKTQKWTDLTHDSAIDGHPVYSVDGKAIYYTADNAGVYNIRRYDLATAKKQTLTNVVSAALSPGVAENGDLFYLGYTGDGLDVYKVAKQQQANTSLPSGRSAPSGQFHAYKTQRHTGKSQPYSAWQSLRPRWWFPHLHMDDDRTEYGIITGGSDGLRQHQYSLDIAYDVDNQWSLGVVNYVYDGWYPLIKFEGERSHFIYTDENGVRSRVRRVNSQVLEMAFPILGIESSWSFNLGIFKDSASDVWRNTGVQPGIRFTDNVLGLAVLYDSSNYYSKSISRSSGREINLVLEDSDKLSDSNFSGQVLLADWREFIQISDAHVFAFRYVEGKGEANTRNFRLGGVKDSSIGVSSIANPVFGTPFNHRKFSLRGYPEGLPQLTGKNMRMASAEYRFPLFNIERGFMAPPVGIDKIHATLFYDAGTAWQADANPEQYYRGAGVEFNLDTVLFYSMPIRLAIGYAEGLDAGGHKESYLRLGASF